MKERRPHSPAASMSAGSMDSSSREVGRREDAHELGVELGASRRVAGGRVAL